MCDMMFMHTVSIHHFWRQSCKLDYYIFLNVFFSQVAERVSAERAESVGNGNSCGYQIRLQR